MRKSLALGLLVFSAAANAVNYDVQLLQSLSPGSTGAGTGTLAYGMNDYGTVVGTSYNSTTGVKEAVYWDSNGIVTSIGQEGIARAVNNSGVIVGEAGSDNLFNQDQRAFKYEGGVYTDIGNLGGAVAGAYDINDNGVITGYACTEDRTACVFSSNGFRYEGGVMTGLGTVSSPTGYSRGHGINDAGIIAGRASEIDFSGSDKFLTIWDSSNNLDFNPGPYTYSTAEDINNSGTITGHAHDANGDMKARVWDVNGNLLQTMGTFGGLESYSYSLNELGIIVGYATNAAEEKRAFVSYDGGATIIDLNTLANDLSGWASLDIAYAINENGEIVGRGTLTSGEEAAFRLTASVVPLPAAAWLFLSGLGILAGIRRRRA